jgi:murein DD-endopeptidase MepM/ murein hydrolase activator NlpD
MYRMFLTNLSLFVLLGLGLFLVACGPASGGALAQVQPVPTVADTAVSPTDLPTATAIPSFTATAPPTLTALPTATSTATPAPTLTQSPPTPTPTPTATVTRPSDVLVGRECPAEWPQKPEYNRFYLGARAWPTPDPGLSEAHFWLAKPLPGGGRFLVNNTFPYGSDGNGRYLLHNGVDSAEELGTPVLAAADGLVVYAGPDADAWFGWRCDWYGHLVVVQHDFTWLDQPVYTLYGHVLGITVETGQRVSQGEQVAEIGFGGAAITPHLHFEVRVGENQFDATRNPMLWIDPGTTRGVLAGRLVDPDGRPWQGVTVTLIDGRGEEVQFLYTWTYLDDPDHFINPDEGYAENFVFSDLPPGSYELFVKVQDVEYRQPVEIIAGALSQVEIITGPLLSETGSQ